MFGSTNNLRRVYSCMSGKQIGYDTSYAQINSRLYAKQFDSHKGTGYRCIGGSGKTATNPSPANRLMGNGMIKDKALPKVAPTKNKGVTSPPLKPTPIVNVVKSVSRGNHTTSAAPKRGYDGRHTQSDVLGRTQQPDRQSNYYTSCYRT